MPLSTAEFSFPHAYARAVATLGEEALRERFPPVRSPAELRALPDHRYLSAMSKRVFAAGFRWSVIEHKWPGFEEAFGGFAVDAVAALTPAQLARLAQDRRIVRNRSKLVSTVHNARFVAAIRCAHGGFGAWLAEWPPHDVVGLWAALHAGGSRLGPDTAAWFLRLVGYDTFRFTPHTVAALIQAGVVSGRPTSRRDQRAAQAALVSWSVQSGLSLSAVHVVLESAADPQVSAPTEGARAPGC